MHKVIYTKQTKVKIFSSNNYVDLENAINEFIKDKTVIDIRYTTEMVPTKVNEYGAIKALDVCDHALIIYEEMIKTL